MQLKMQKLRLDLLQSDSFNLAKPSPKKYSTKYYRLLITKQSSDSKIEAIPINSQNKDNCHTLTIWLTDKHPPKPDRCWKYISI